MTAYSQPMAAVEPLPVLRRLRAVQAWSLLGWSAASIGSGLILMRSPPRPEAFWTAAGLEGVIWGLIDAVFAGLGVAGAIRAARTPISPQAEADEFLSAEKLLRALRFNHKLNVGYMATATVLLAAALYWQNATLAGHGAGVAVQGGFLLLFDWAYVQKYQRLMTAPAL